MDAARTELLVRLLSQHQEDIFRYVFALIPNEEDARDVLQETCVALYRKFDEYDSDKPFLAWAYGFAYREILKHRERSARHSRLLDPQIVELLAREREEHEPILQARLQALEHCLEKLSSADRALIHQRYQEKASTEEMVQRSGTSRRTLFRHLERIRGLLSECIDRRVRTFMPQL